MSPETLEAIESVVVMGGVIAGGAWALYRFFNDLQVALEIRVRTREIGPGGTDAKCLVEAVVEIENKGTTNGRLPWRDIAADGSGAVRPLHVFRVTQTLKGSSHELVEQVAVAKSRDPNDPAIGMVVRSGVTECIPFLLELDRDQVYLLSFVAHLTPRDHRRSLQAGTPSSRPTSWTGRTYVRVPSRDAGTGVSLTNDAAP